MEEIEVIEKKTPYNFSWYINNPFLPWRKMVTSFYQRSESLTEWIMTFQPEERDFNNWVFSFSLQCVKSEDNYVIASNKMEVIILENKKILESKLEIDYSFHQENRHTYEFRMSSKRLRHHLEIQVKLFLEEKKFVIPEPDLYVGAKMDNLSKDMSKLLSNPIYYDMRLRCNTDRCFGVHSYIMRARWNTFFDHHPVREDIDFGELNIVTLDISDEVLSIILTFVYSAKIDIEKLEFDDILRTELMQVIDTYKLIYLYGCFVPGHLRQLRETTNQQYESKKVFLLKGSGGLPRRYREKLDLSDSLGGGQNVYFRTKIVLSGVNPSFSYWFKCAAQNFSPVLYALVNFKYKKTGMGCNTTSILHEDLFTIDRNNWKFGKFNLRGQCGDLNNFLASTDQKESALVKHSIICKLRFSDGTTVLDIFSSHCDDEEDEVVDCWTDYFPFSMLRLLGNQMLELLQGDSPKDLKVFCRSKDESYSVTHLHKAIFVTRIPGWRDVLINIPRGNHIPDEVECFFSKETFDLVIEFIYSGSILNLPRDDYENIEYFADLGEIESLAKYVKEIDYERKVARGHPTIESDFVKLLNEKS